MSSVVNYTTAVPVTQSLAEMQERLASSGAAHIGVGYEDGYPIALTFVLRGPHGPRDFHVPVDVDAMQRLLRSHEDEGRFKAMRKAKGHFTTREHAARVAWRVMKDWLGATLALVECDLLRLDEVMLPHLIVDDGRTLAQAYRDRESALALTTGGDS